MRRLFTLLLAILSLSTCLAKGEPAALEVPIVKASYEIGEYDSNLVVVKERLKELGYYSAAYTKDRMLTGYYNATLNSRTKLFQIFNNIPVSGQLDNDTIKILFSQNAISEEQFYQQSPENIPEHLRVVTTNVISPTYSGDTFSVPVEVKSYYTGKTVVAFEASFIPYSAWNEKMNNYLDDETVSTLTNLKAGSTTKSDKCSFYGYKEIYDLFVGITKFRLDDGTIVTVPKDQIVYHSWRGPFKTQ